MEQISHVKNSYFRRLNEYLLLQVNMNYIKMYHTKSFSFLVFSMQVLYNSIKNEKLEWAV